MRRQLPAVDDAGSRLALGWLLLATAAVAAAALFAILLVFSRLPLVGMLLPGADFYRVALTLHVDLSQGVWFMAFAGVLWSLACRPGPAALELAALGLAAAGALLMAVSPGLGALRPVMSNYVPVLDHRWFLAGLVLYGLGVAIKATMAAVAAGFRPTPRSIGLRLAAVLLLAALGLGLATGRAIDARADGLAYFEALFWGPGHVWQFCLTTLMAVAWLGLSAPGIRLPPLRVLGGLLVLGALPGLAAVCLPAFLDPLDPVYFSRFTELMRWASWPVPLALAALLALAHGRAGVPPGSGFGLSVLLLVAGLLLGTQIAGQTTLVTAHYHGTIGAVTVAFMALTYRLLPNLGASAPTPRAAARQLQLYGHGILLMMAGLAGAGLMGAPRKVPGNLGFEFGVESLSRLAMGLGGCLATAGILTFLFLVLRSLVPHPRLEADSHA
jgi:hypothetical protein